MVKGWLDLDGDGRRIERIIKLCETQITTQIAEKNHDLILAYIDRLIKASNAKLQIQDLVIGFKQLSRLAQKEYAEEITHERLVLLK